MRFTVHLKSGGNPTVDIGHAYLQILPGDGTKMITYDGPTKNSLGNTSPLFSNMGDTAEYDQLNIPGAPYYKVDITDPNFDDVYLATGSNAQARIEIGNQATYAASTNLTVATINSWSDNLISATIRQGNFSDYQNAYLYVIDKDGNVNSNGFPISFSPQVKSYSIADFLDLFPNWLKHTTTTDVNFDNIVNTKDLGIMLSKWK